MKNITEFKDETYNPTQIYAYTYNMQISDNSIAYCVFDKEREKYVFLKEYSVSGNTKINKQVLENFLSENTNLKTAENLKILWLSQKSVIIPKAFYQEEKQFQLLNFNTEINSDTDKILVNKLKTDDYNIFSVNKSLFNLINDNIKSCKIYNQGTLLIHSALFSNSSDKIKLQLDATNFFIDIVVSKKTKLIYRNTFIYKSASDLVFFVLNIFDKLKINIDKTEVYISGTIDSASPEIALLKNYIKKIKYKFPDFNYSYTFNDIKISKFTQLLNLENCE